MQHVEPFPFHGEVRRLTLGPHDRVVLNVAARLTHDQARHIGGLLREALDLPANSNRVIVLEHGMELSVIAGEDKGI
jgi:hypothetical protein